jgi:hypothetical protein
MESKVEFNDFTIKVKEAMDDRINAVLEECAGELESQVKRNSRVDTGKTKNSFRHKVVDSEHAAYIGSSDENAIWEEFGTGEHALHGDGRKGGWAYEDPKTGETIWTYGKKPSRAFWNAYTSQKDKIIKRIQNFLKGL